jgi:XTP/dITP diphosphohydrolase
MRLSNTIVLATLNRHKFEEFQALFRSHPECSELELQLAQSFVRNPNGLKYVETHSTYMENAIAKARLLNQGSHYPSLGDDSGIEVMALEGRPGVRSHRYATPRAGVPQDIANVEQMLSELRGKSQRDARFVCSLALVVEGILVQGTGTLEGTIADGPRGTTGFGYDPIFIPKGSNQTLAEMGSAAKNKISHRAKALEALMTEIAAKGIVFAKP